LHCSFGFVQSKASHQDINKSDDKTAARSPYKKREHLSKSGQFIFQTFGDHMGMEASHAIFLVIFFLALCGVCACAQ